MPKSNNCSVLQYTANEYLIIEQNLFGNQNIVQNKQSIFLSNWSQGGIKKVKDIWNSESNCWQIVIIIFNQLKKKINWITE